MVNNYTKLKKRHIHRFWLNTNKDSGVFHKVNGKRSQCWLYEGAHDSDDYGVFGFGGKLLGAHVVSYMIAHKLSKRPKRHVLHHCDNPPCVRPKHLFKGTHQENMDDKLRKGRQPRGEKVKQSVLTKVEVKKIRDRYASGKYSQLKLANLHSVCETSIRNIINRKTWAHI